MPKVIFAHIDQTTEAQDGDWMYDVVHGCSGGIPFSCKAGACGTCATEVKEGRENLGEQSARQIRTLEAHSLAPGVYRLPCLCDVHGDMASRHPQFRYDSALFAPNPDTWAGRRGRVTDLLDDSIRPEDGKTTEVYLCGGRRMIEDCTARLKAKGFPEEALHNESFF